jgi:hypothetical protein
MTSMQPRGIITLMIAERLRSALPAGIQSEHTVKPGESGTTRLAVRSLKGPLGNSSGGQWMGRAIPSGVRQVCVSTGRPREPDASCEQMIRFRIEIVANLTAYTKESGRMTV